jgi:hypothetical protein
MRAAEIMHLIYRYAELHAEYKLSGTTSPDSDSIRLILQSIARDHELLAHERKCLPDD